MRHYRAYPVKTTSPSQDYLPVKDPNQEVRCDGTHQFVATANCQTRVPKPLLIQTGMTSGPLEFVYKW